MVTKNVIQRYLDYDWEQLTPASIRSAKRCLLDTLGVLFKGASYDSSLTLKKGLQWKFDYVPEPLDGALFYGTASHSVEMDDFHRGGTVHPGVVVVPAVLATLLERQELGLKTSGKDVLRAVILGYDLMIRVGMAAKGTLYERGYHPTALCGPFGSALASSLLYGHDVERAVMAQGIAGGLATGLMAYKANGAWTKRLNAGFAARTGVMARRLAGAGFTGPDTIFEDRFGFFNAFAPQVDLDVLMNFDGLEIERITFKFYSSCRFTHGPIDALRKILSDHQIDPNDVLQVDVEVHEMAYKATMQPEVRKYEPDNIVDGQFSIPYCLALMALYHEVSPDYFTDEYLHNHNVRAWAKKVKGAISDRYNALFPQQNACKVSVLTTTNRYEYEVLNALGDPENPLSDRELEEKFVRLTNGILDPEEQQQLIQMVSQLEHEEDCERFVDMTCKHPHLSIRP